MSDIVESVLAAIREHRAWRDIEHPQYIEGFLYLTRAQLSNILRDAPPPDPRYHWGVATSAVHGIQVIEVKPSTPVVLPSGKILVNPAFEPETFYIFDPKKISGHGEWISL